MNNRSVQGFTLLEVLIAITIMVTAFSTILMIESNSLDSADDTKKMNIMTMLVKNRMAKTEVKMKGQAFGALQESSEGRFEPPYQNYIWKQKIQEIEFPEMNLGRRGGQQGKQQGGGGQQNRMMSVLMNIITNYLSESVREVKVQVQWKPSQADQGGRKVSLSTYWVDLTNEVSLNP